MNAHLVTEDHAHDSGERTSPLAGDETPWPEDGFEQQRALEAVRGRLFGRPRHLSIARYRIDGRIGAGGMGEVYLGFDAALGRKVAVKRVRAEIDDEIQRGRLRREARALAQLSHPNVVQVYEVGEHEGQTFVAMEFIAGETLSAYLTQERSWQEIVARFAAAGRGLAAAHSAGVVHRDFKPDNVLVDGEGRVRVVDFGLAISGSGVVGGGSGVSLGRLTHAAGVAGTTRYMAHEQLCGQEVDARSDQFSFCVALHEALYRRPPFTIESVAARKAALEADRPTPPGSWRDRGRRRVPRRIWTLLRRGLRLDPAQRWPTLDPLLDALEAVAPRRRRAAVAGVVALAVGASAGWAGWSSWSAQAQRSRCAEVGAELAGVWDDAREQALRASFRTAGVGHAEHGFARLDAALADWAQAWTVERGQQCEAARTGRDGAALARARRACLERQRRRVVLLTDALAEGSPALIDRAIDLADTLPDPRRCAAAAVLEEPSLAAAEGEGGQGQGRAERDAAIEALRLELAELEQLRLLGRPRPDQAAALTAAADRIAPDFVRAAALAEQGRSELEGGSAARGLALLEDAGDLALRAGADRLLAELWLELALHRLTDYPDEALGRRDASLAAAQWARLGPAREAEVEVQAKLAFVTARVARLDGDLDGARAAYQQALALLGERQSSTRPAILDNLAELAPPTQALALREEALASAEALWGADHPRTGDYLFQLGAAALEVGEVERGQALLDRARVSWRADHLEPRAELGRADLLLAAAALADYREGEDDTSRAQALARARAHGEEAAAIFAVTLPTVHAGHGDAADLRSRVAALAGDREQALALAREALAHWERALGPRAAEVVEARLDVANNELGLGALAQAEAEYRRILDGSEADEDPRLLALAELGLLEVALRRGALARARGWIDAIEARGPAVLGDQELSLAIMRALVDLREGCRTCAREADLAARVEQAGWGEAAIQAWLGELGVSAEEQGALGLTSGR